MKALILAAGYATRLYPLTKKYPKPLLEVKGRPIIDYIIDKLAAVDALDEIFVVTNSKFIGNFRGWIKTVKWSKKITLVSDRTKNNRDRLGAIGDISFVIKHKNVRQDLLIVGGDNLFSGSLVEFLAAVEKNKAAAGLGLYRLKHKKDASRYGVVKLNRAKNIVSFVEKPKIPQSDLVAMCLYFIAKNNLKSVGAYMRQQKSKADATGSYIAWLKDKVEVYGHVFSGAWFDIGDRKYLTTAKEKFAN